MKAILVFFLLFQICFFSFSQNSTNYNAYEIFTKEGKKTTFSKVLKTTSGKKVIFFGELHDNPIAHWLQLEMLIYLYQINRKNLICGSEMFERDNQMILNKYLSNQLNDKSFKDSCRLWPNYKTDYKPLLDSCKTYNIPWIATNIPRKYASLVYKKSLKVLDTLSTIEKQWIAPLPFPLDTNLSQYKALNSGDLHNGINFVHAQAIKDATMAYSISQNLTENSVFYHLNGAYHSDYFQGILWYLHYYSQVQFSNMLTISVVSQKEISKLDSEYFGKADFIICVPEKMTSTH